MRIAHIILPDASHYERKSQRIDHAGLAPKHEVTLLEPHMIRDTAIDVVHFYGNDLAAKSVMGLKQRYIASAEPHRGRFRFPFHRPPAPHYIVSPIAPVDPNSRVQLLPEAVDEGYFQANLKSPISNLRIIGTFGPHRPGVASMVEQTLARLQRTRDDIEWRVLDSVPTPGDLRDVDLWVDPATSESDFDGFVAEASAAGKAVVASRTAINAHRLEKGRTGLLVPARDANELTHAILSALFKSEVASLKIEAAKQTAGKFRPRQRLRVLERIYETLVR